MLTQQKGILPEKLTVAQLVTKILSFKITGIFTTELNSTHRSYATKSIRATASHYIYLRPILTLSSRSFRHLPRSTPCRTKIHRPEIF